MNPDLILESMFEWKYIWLAILALYTLASEVIYFLMCKFDIGESKDGDGLNWIQMKFGSFTLGGILTLMLILFIPLTISLISALVNNPLNALKVSGAIIGAALGIFLFFYANYKIWEKYN